MADLDVHYVCSCASLKTISKIYFCRHCLRIRCGYCVCHEIDSHFCSNCLENLPSPEVRLKKNKCTNCFNCPCCFQTLTTKAAHPLNRITALSEKGEETKTTPKKVYYMTCPFCRWSSRDAGIPDQIVATGGWPDPESPNLARINALIDHQKILASMEKHLRERTKSKRAYMQFEKFGLTSAMARKRCGRPILSEPHRQSIDELQPAKASEEVDALPPGIFTEEVDITKITTLEQRLKQPEMQVENVHDLRPMRKQFMVKRSQRCRACEHNVSKPDYSPISIKFKIQLSAFYHVPEITVMNCEPLRAGKSSELLLKFCNPTQHVTDIVLLPLGTSTNPTLLSASGQLEEVKRDNMQLGSESPNLIPSAIRQISVVEEPVPMKISANSELFVQETAITLPARDDTAEYDDPSDTLTFKDDPKFVVWRKANKVVLRMNLTPHSDISEGSVITAGFVLQHGYVNTIATLENKQPQKIDLKTQLLLTVGRVSSC